MRIPYLMLIISILIVLGVDAYIYLRLKKISRWRPAPKIQLWSAIILYIIMIVGLCLPMRSGESAVLLEKMWILFGFMTFLVAKAVFVILDLIGRIPQLFKRQPIPHFPIVAAAIALVVFVSMWWGALINRFNIDIEDVDVEIADLPEAFEGYRIAQISDLHVGTYGQDTTYLAELVNAINQINADAIFFTGDIVNQKSSELEPFIATLSRLHAPDGVYSILGNHDYGDYYDWSSDQAKRQSFDRLIDMQHTMGWKLLLNEHDFLRSGADSIAIIGVENVGDPPFTIYGDLAASYPDLSDGNTKILLTHNPAHWNMEIEDNPQKNVALTLSGHTHAMQIRVLGLSPATWRYKNWGGMYHDREGDHKLYVNIGIGTVGMPMRLGATPEITVFTLHRKK